MKKLHLTKEEKDILRAVENGEYVSILTFQRKRNLEAMARYKLKFLQKTNS